MVSWCSTDKQAERTDSGFAAGQNWHKHGWSARKTYRKSENSSRTWVSIAVLARQPSTHEAEDEGTLADGRLAWMLAATRIILRAYRGARA